MKIICAGLQKTGTKTMSEAFRILGYNVHDVFQQFMLDKELWYKVLQNSASEEDYKDHLTDVDVVTDLPGNIMWEQILGAFPDAKVILTVRSSEDEWYESIKNHAQVQTELVPPRYRVIGSILLPLLFPLRNELIQFSGKFLQASLGISGLRDSPSETIVRSRYRQHNIYVKASCPKKQLLVYNVKDGWEPLCKFLEMDVPGTPFPKRNVRASIVRKLIKNEYEHDSGFERVARKQTMTRLGIITAVITLIVIVVVTCLLTV